MYIFLRVRMYAGADKYKQEAACTLVYIQYVYVCTDVYASVCMYVCLFVCLCVQVVEVDYR